MQINLLCLAGAALGLFCLFLPWGVYTSGSPIHNPHEYAFLTDEEWYAGNFQHYPLSAAVDLLLPAIAFSVGSLVAFITPLGSLGQVSGIVIFYIRVDPLTKNGVETFKSFTLVGEGLNHLSYAVGFYLATCAAALTCVSLLAPMVLEYSKDGIRLSRRGWPPRQILMAWRRYTNPRSPD